jgi:hypothetical protein
MKSIGQLIPWSLRGLGPFLNTYGDAAFFGSIRSTPPIPVRRDAPAAVHSAVPHRYLYAYLVAIKSLLRFHRNLAVLVHDDGSLLDADCALIEEHIPGVEIVRRADADRHFRDVVGDDFLARVRGSYTSYLKLFDPTLYAGGRRIVILDTDTLFLKRPDAIIDWAERGGPPWYHCSPRGAWTVRRRGLAQAKRLQDVHIQTSIMDSLEDVNRELSTQYRLEQGFCSGFIGYDPDTVRFPALRALFDALFRRLGDRIFRWGAEQTTHGLLLCSRGARALPVQDYFVFTRANAGTAHDGTFVHFVGENRFHRLIYPRLARKVVGALA